MKRKSNNRVEFKVNLKKTAEVLAWLANQAPNVTIYYALKALFFADIESLNNYGRPITGDCYVAMEDGPVASCAYDLIKGNEFLIKKIGEKMPFQLKNGKYLVPLRKPDLRYFSKSDLHFLEEAWKKINRLGWQGAWDETHAHKAYRNTWDNRHSDADEMDTAELITDDEKIKELIHDAKFIKI